MSPKEFLRFLAVAIGAFAIFILIVDWLISW